MMEGRRMDGEKGRRMDGGREGGWMEGREGGWMDGGKEDGGKGGLMCRGLYIHTIQSEESSGTPHTV